MPKWQPFASGIGAAVLLASVLSITGHFFGREQMTGGDIQSLPFAGGVLRQIVVHVAKEIAPIAAFGGVAQLTGGLTHAQAAARDMEVFTIIPKYVFLRGYTGEPTLRLRMRIGNQHELVSVHLLSHRVERMSNSALLLDWSADKWQHETAQCALDTMAHDLLAVLPESLVDSVNIPDPRAANSLPHRCMHYLLIDEPNSLRQLWQATISPKHIYALPADVSYSVRDTFFGSAAGYMTIAIQTAADTLMRAQAGRFPRKPIVRALGHPGTLTQHFRPLPLPRAAELPGVPAQVTGDNVRNGNTAQVLAMAAVQPTLKMCPSVVLQVHGATNSMAALVVRSLRSTACPVAVVYTLHDFTSEKDLQLASKDIAQYTALTLHPDAFLGQQTDRAIASNIGLLEAHSASTVSDNLAALLAGSFLHSSAWTTVDSTILRTVQ